MGSLIIDPILKKIGFIEFVPYTDFISASKTDQKIEVLSEMNNTYRTLCALILLIVVCKAYEMLTDKFPVLLNCTIYLVTLALLVLFLFSYKKQTEYVKKRVAATKAAANP
jgi:Ca2+/Na+ antiporter